MRPFQSEPRTDQLPAIPAPSPPGQGIYGVYQRSTKKVLSHDGGCPGAKMPRLVCQRPILASRGVMEQNEGLAAEEAVTLVVSEA